MGKRKATFYDIFLTYISNHSVRDTFEYFGKKDQDSLDIKPEDIEKISNIDSVKKLCENINTREHKASKNNDDIEFSDSLFDNDLFLSIYESIYGLEEVDEQTEEENAVDIDNYVYRDIIVDFLKEVGKMSLLSDTEIKECFNKIADLKIERARLQAEINSINLEPNICVNDPDSIDVDLVTKMVNENLERIETLNKEILQKDQDINDTENYVVEHNLRLVVSIAKKYQHRGLDLIELIQEGSAGLKKRVSRYDVNRGAKFSTFATIWIKRGIKDALNKESRTIKLPTHVIESINKIKVTRNKLANELNRDPSIEEISEASGINVERIEELFRINQDVVSLDRPVDTDDPDANFGDFQVDPNAESVEDFVSRKDTGIRIMKMIDELEDPGNMKSKFDDDITRIAKIVKDRNGINPDEECVSLEKLGELFGVKHQRISHIESKAYNTIRAKYRSQESEKELLPIYDDGLIERKKQEFEKFVFKNNLHIKVDEFHRPSGKYRLRCLTCGKTWSVLIKDLGPETMCIKCLLDKKRGLELENAKLSEQQDKEFRSDLADIAKYIGISITELHDVLYRFNTDEIKFLVDKFKVKKTPEELKQYNDLVLKVQNYAKIDKQSASARRRNKKHGGIK